MRFWDAEKGISMEHCGGYLEFTGQDINGVKL
jgi:hypothetical protein